MRILLLSALSFCLILLTLSYNCYAFEKTKKTRNKKSSSVQHKGSVGSGSVTTTETFSLMTQSAAVSADLDSVVGGRSGNPEETKAPEQRKGGRLSLKRQIVKKMIVKLPGREKNALSKKSLSSDYGGRKDPIKNRMSFHTGIDISRPTGTGVYAWDKGMVSFVGWVRGYGRTVDIVHPNGVKTRYAHLDDTFVAKGQTIEDGQTIGEVGSTGRTTGPNLHFEVIVAGNAKDPNNYLKNDRDIVESRTTNS